MSLNANALVTLADAKDHLDIPPATTTSDARVERFINTASQLIEEYCNRKFIYQSYDIRRDGRRQDRIQLNEFPIIAVTNVWDDQSWEWGSDKLIPATEIAIEEECILVLQNRKFSKGNQNVRIQFTAGFVSPVTGGLGAPIPMTLEYTCLMTVEWLMQLRQDRRIGVTSKSKQSESISFFDQTGLPPQVMTMLAEFVKFEIPSLESGIGST